MQLTRPPATCLEVGNPREIGGESRGLPGGDGQLTRDRIVLGPPFDLVVVLTGREFEGPAGIADDMVIPRRPAHNFRRFSRRVVKMNATGYGLAGLADNNFNPAGFGTRLGAGTRNSSDTECNECGGEIVHQGP